MGRRRIASLVAGRHISHMLEKNPYPKSEETRKKLSAAFKGKPLSAANLAALAPARARRFSTEESRKELSEKLRQFYKTEEGKAIIAKSLESRKGLRRTPEANAKVSAALKGKPWSAARRQAHLDSKAGTDGTTL